MSNRQLVSGRAQTEQVRSRSGLFPAALVILWRFKLSVRSALHAIECAICGLSALAAVSPTLQQLNELKLRSVNITLSTCILVGFLLAVIQLTSELNNCLPS